MAIECNIAPFINIEFYLTGAWGEQRATHKHAGIDIATGLKSNVYNMFEGTVISVTHSGYGGGYGPNIIIQEDSGRTWLYGDLEAFTNWSVGDRIKKRRTNIARRKSNWNRFNRKSRSRRTGNANKRRIIQIWI